MTVADFTTSSRPDYDDWDLEPLDAEPGELDWRDDALCAQTDPEAFFPEKGGSTRDAKAVCAMCDVREQCLIWALTNDEAHGIWAGLSTKERRNTIKQMGLSDVWGRLDPAERRELLANSGLVG